MKVVAVIPARMASSRFPGKPLVSILGVPMIEHVRRRVLAVQGLHRVVVAACDEEVKKVVEGFGGEVVMTSPSHERATDRIEEAVQNIEADVVINVQGDEPMVSEKSITDVVAPFRLNQEVLCSCLVYPLTEPSELESLNIVKTVLSGSRRILYLSRAAIPGHAYSSHTAYFKQSGIMAFTKSFLQKYRTLTPTPLEAKESVDLLRILEHDYWVQGVISKEETKGVDVPAQVAEVEQAILADPLQKKLFETRVKEWRSK